MNSLHEHLLPALELAGCLKGSSQPHCFGLLISTEAKTGSEQHVLWTQEFLQWHESPEKVIKKHFQYTERNGPRQDSKAQVDLLILLNSEASLGIHVYQTHHQT